MTAKHVEKYFDERARVYDKMITSHFLISRIRKHEDLAFLKLLGSCDGEIILDAGCGTRHHVGYLLERGAKKVVGVDVSSKMLEIAKRKFKNHNNVQFFHGDILEFECPRKFDKVISIGVLDHVKDASVVLDKFYKCLKKGGILIASFPNKSLFGKVYKILTKARGSEIRDVSRHEARKFLKEAGFKYWIFDGLTLMCKATKNRT